jgi:hypothetical protein
MKGRPDGDALRRLGRTNALVLRKSLFLQRSPYGLSQQQEPDQDQAKMDAQHELPLREQAADKPAQVGRH